MIEGAVAALRTRRRVPFDKPNDFAVVTPDQLVTQFQAITSGITGAMVFVALISLVVGVQAYSSSLRSLRAGSTAGQRRPQAAFSCAGLPASTY